MADPVGSCSTPSMQDEPRVLRMFPYVSSDDGADDIDLELMFPRPVESRLHQLRRDTCAAHVLRNFGVDQFENRARQRVLKICHAAIAFDLETSAGDALS